MIIDQLVNLVAHAMSQNKMNQGPILGDSPSSHDTYLGFMLAFVIAELCGLQLGHSSPENLLSFRCDITAK